MKKLKMSIIFTAIALSILLATQVNLAPAETTGNDDLPEPQTPYINIFADFYGIDGESIDEDHENWIDLKSFDFYMNQPARGVSGISRRRGDVQFEDITLTKGVDKATPKLMDKLARGQVIDTVTIEFSRYIADGNKVFYKYELENVLITSYQSSASIEDYPEDTLTLNFEEIKVTYTEYDDDGTSMGNVEWEWKVETGGA